jgi:hypothetical protein
LRWMIIRRDSYILHRRWSKVSQLRRKKKRTSLLIQELILRTSLILILIPTLMTILMKMRI